MALTLKLSPELEAEVRRQAEEEQVEVTEFATNALLALLNERGKDTRPVREALLLRKARSFAPSPAHRRRYRDLRAKLKAETLTPEEHQELITLSDEREALNLECVTVLAEVANLRGVPLESVIAEFRRLRGRGWGSD